MNDLRLVQNTRKIKNESGIKNASGKFVEYNKIGVLTDELNGVPLSSKPYYLNKDNVINLLSLSLLSYEYRIFTDTVIDNAFYVFDDDGKYLWLERYPISNLYQLDINLHANGKNVLNVITVEGRMKELSSLECSRVKAVRDLKHALVCPSDKDLAHTIEHNS